VTIDDITVTAPTFERAVAIRFGDGARIRSRRSVGGGSINRTSIIEIDGYGDAFLKENSIAHRGLFEEEARGLLALRAADGPRVPDVLALYSDRSTQYLLLEVIETGRRGNDFFPRFGEELAGMHRTNRSPRCGFDRDNHIGETEQPNAWIDDWHQFFAERRLIFQGRLARDRGRIDAAMLGRIERLAARLPELIPPLDDGGASILHGDLWGGNYLVDGSGAPVLIDPAVYYGHREADLAMTELFGGFGRAFLDAYREKWPITPGYGERRDIYNLYHLLNHLNLFGSSYLGSCAAIVRRFA
jgi:fructosamine-3-kinase